MEKKVLIIDDSNTNNILLQSILETEGISSSIVFSGEEAFEFLKSEKPSLILLDIMMPKIDGFAVLKEIKKDTNTNHIPVIFITASNESNIKHKAIESGAVDLIHKPVNINKVLELVKSHSLT